MYHQNNNNNNERNHLGSPPPPMSPRISFSNDFVESSTTFHSHNHHQMRTYRDAPVSSDFEFSVSNYSMMSADELFSQGRLLPLKESYCSSKKTTTTLREELEVDDDEEEEEEGGGGGGGFRLKPPPHKSSTRWKGFLGLRKSHIGSRKVDKNGGSGTPLRSSGSISDAGNSSQEMMNNGGTSSGSKNVEFRM